MENNSASGISTTDFERDDRVSVYRLFWGFRYNRSNEFLGAMSIISLKY